MWAQPAASGNRPLLRESEEGRDGGGAARPKGHSDVPGHQPAGAALSFQLHLLAPALPPSPTVKTEVRWEHLKRLIEIFRKV